SRSTAWRAERGRPAITSVEQTLDAGHHGLEEPKRRILEYLAVRRLGGRATQTVLCLVGPPGTGKTSLARAIAEALGRPFVRIALGGMHDESELRGHRLSFIAAAPGRILEGVARAGSMNAVVLLDELDKVDARGNRSPVGALLEILDPEQSGSFRDNYLGFGYDLSHLFFICTANLLHPIPEPLRDRLELIELDGYTLRQKRTIAHQHLLPSLADDHGLPHPLELPDGLLTVLIERHTREAGVRQLRRALAGLHRDRALKLARALDTDSPHPDAIALATAPLTAADLTQRLGSPKHRPPSRRDALLAGVATGLSVHGHTGGDLCFFEAVWLPGSRDDLLRMTGRLGDVMREAAWNALALLRTLDTGDTPIFDHSTLPDPIARDLHTGTFHLHVPEASTPKDGPSAGVAIFFALLSALRSAPLRSDIAMTGELNLSGEVMAVGGIRAKLLAAERAGIGTVFIPHDNRDDVPDDLTLEVVPIHHLSALVARRETMFHLPNNP
ncbi:MAG: S16 family serine protease, partial [Myxococcota bacterium]